MSKKTEKFDILSPDGFSIFPDRTYNTPEEGAAAFAEWVKRFEKQGYYSSNNGRIALEDLADECTTVPVD